MKNRYWGTDVLIVILSLSTALFAGIAMFTNPDKALYIFGRFLFLIFILVINIGAIRRAIRGVFFGHGKGAARQQLSFENLSLPLAIVSKGGVVWYNDAFRDKILQGEDCYLTPVEKIIPGFDPSSSTGREGLSITLDKSRFTVYSARASDDNTLWVCYFVDDTLLKYEASEYHLSRPVIMEIVVDTYDEILMNLRDSHRATIMAMLDKLVEDTASRADGISMKLGVSRYRVIMEDRYFEKIRRGKFEILSKARGLDGNNVTVSIGAGRGGKTFRESDALAKQALDMALGRGGDQAVIKGEDGYEFFGGTRRGVEKRSKVRSRIIADALRDVIIQSETVLIMGHKNSDFDAVGSAAGMAEAVRSLGRKAYIAINEEVTQAGNLIEKIKSSTDIDLFISYDRARRYAAASDTLLIIVDTNATRMTEFPELVTKCRRRVLIDHHRRSPEYISDTVVSYHETYASSASELVTELLQYILPANYRMDSIWALALLSGIMLDTRNFSESVGVRTYEAAAYLRRHGALSVDVLKMFSVSKEVYKAKTNLVNSANIYKGVAIAMSDNLQDDLYVAIPQAANDLLTLDNVKASIVAVKMGDRVNISARSLGDMNVQLLMERLGGGGHLTMAGAQLSDVSVAQAEDMIKQTIDNYRG